MASRRRKIIGFTALASGAMALGLALRHPARPDLDAGGSDQDDGDGAGAGGGAGAGVVEGSVVDPAGAPAAGVLVTLARAPDGTGLDRAAALAPAAFVRTDAAGRFRLAALAAGRYGVTATPARPGLVPAHADVLRLGRGETRSLRLALTVGGTLLQGQARDAAGRPIAGARIVAARRPAGQAPHLHLALTDNRGRYQLSLAPGMHQLSAEADGYARVSEAVAIDRDLAQDIDLKPAGRIAGRVIDRGSGQPVIGAEVTVAAGPDRSEPHTTWTDARGGFVLDGLDSGEHVVRAHAGPLVGCTGWLLVLAGQVSEVVVGVDPGFALEGRVTAEGRRRAARAGAEVIAEGWAGGPFFARARTGRDGAWRIEGLLPGAYGIRVATTAGMHGQRAATIVDRDLAGQDLALAAVDAVDAVDPGVDRPAAPTERPEATASLVGWVRTEEGAPAAGATVVASSAGDSHGAEVVTTAGPDGGYALRGLTAGPVRVSARASRPVGGGGGGFRPSGAPVELVAAAERRLDLRITRGRSVRGRVLLPDGRPAAGALVDAGPGAGAPRTTSDDNGAFSFAEVATDRPVTLWADLPGHAPAQARDVALEDEEVTLRLQPASSIAGVAVDCAGRPVTNFVVRALAADAARLGDAAHSWGMTHTPDTIVHDAGGAFSLDRLPPGPLEITVQTARGVAASVWVALSAWERRRDLRLVVQPGVTVRGKVIDESSGVALAGVAVSGGVPAQVPNQVPNDDRCGPVLTDAAGAFVLYGARRARDLVGLELEPRDRPYRPRHHEAWLPPSARQLDVGTVTLSRVR